MRIDLTLGTGDGERDVAVVVPPGATLADVARLVPEVAAVGTTPGRPGWPALASGMRPGAPTAAATTGHRLVVVGGPGAGASVALTAVPVTVGRGAGCGLRLPDPGLSRRHLEARLGPGGAQVRDLGSVRGSTVDGRPVGTAWQPLRDGAALRAGDSFLGLGASPPRPLRVRPAADGTGVVTPVRLRGTGTGVPPLEWPPDPIPVPASPLHLLATTAPAAAGAVLAIAMHSWAFLLLAVVSPLTMLASGAADRWRGRRTRRRMRLDHGRDVAAAEHRLSVALDAEARQRRRAEPSPAEVLATARAPGTGLWARGDHLLQVRVGLGDAPSAIRVTTRGVPTDHRAAPVVRTVPRCVDLGVAPLTISGPTGTSRALARWLVGQLAAAVSPAHLEVVLLADAAGAAAWRWLRWLPHWRHRVATSPAARRSLLAELQPSAGPGRRILLVVDGCGELGAVAPLCAEPAATGLTALCLQRGAAGLPGALVATVDDAGTSVRLPDGALAVADLVDTGWADALARALAPLRPDEGGGALPEQVRLLDLLGDRAPRWDTPGDGLPFVLGTAAEPVVLDLVRDGPHALVAGTTGAGKSELLRSMVLSLAARHPPMRLAFVLIDYKGGAAFAECRLLPHTAGLLTDLDGRLTARALRSLERELRRRETVLAGAGADDLSEYHCGGGADLPRLVIVVDEFAALAEELPDFVTGLVGLAQRGRSLGLHLVLATQRPSGVVSPEIRANAGLRIALRVTDAADSRDVVDCDDAALLDRRVPGRAVFRVAGGEPVRFQTASVSLPRAAAQCAVEVLPLDEWRVPLAEPAAASGGTDLSLLVDAIRAEARRRNLPAVRSPWLPPLPDTVTPPEPTDAGVPIGLADLPDEQAQRPLTVDLAHGTGLLVVGAARSGRTGALQVLALQAGRALSPEQLHVSVVDPRGDLAPLRALPHVGSWVSTPADATVLLQRLAALAGRRDEAVRHLVLVDGLDLLTAADPAGADDAVDALVTLLRTAASTHTTVAVTGDRALLQPRIAGAAALRLVLRLADPADYGVAGLSPRAVPVRMPPGRGLLAPDGCEVQLGRPPHGDALERDIAAIARRWPASAGPRAVVRPLPRSVALDSLAPEPGRILLGVGGEAAEPIAVDLLTAGSRLLVCGSPGSGRSTALLTVLAQAPTATVVAAGTRSPLAAAARAAGVRLLEPGDTELPDGPLLALVDDAEAWQDTPAEAAILAALSASDRSALVVATTTEHAAVGFRGLIGEGRRTRSLLLLDAGPAEAALVDARLPRRDPDRPAGRGVLVAGRSWGEQFARGPVPLQVAEPVMCG